MVHRAWRGGGIVKRSSTAGSLDLALEYLRGHGLCYRWTEDDLRVWEAVCPACRHPSWGLRIRETVRGDPISLVCSAGCSGQVIREALEAEPVHEQIEQALQLADEARDVAARALELAASAHGNPALRQAA
jgi:hypothetical protein